MWTHFLFTTPQCELTFCSQLNENPLFLTKTQCELPLFSQLNVDLHSSHYKLNVNLPSRHLPRLNGKRYDETRRWQRQILRLCIHLEDILVLYLSIRQSSTVPRSETKEEIKFSIKILIHHSVTHRQHIQHENNNLPLWNTDKNKIQHKNLNSPLWNTNRNKIQHKSFKFIFNFINSLYLIYTTKFNKLPLWNTNKNKI